MATVARSRGIRLKSIRTHERLMLTQKGERAQRSSVCAQIARTKGEKLGFVVENEFHDFVENLRTE